MHGDNMEVLLVIHPGIDLAVKLARARGTAPNIYDVPPGLLHDTEFLDALETDVESWQQSIGQLVDRPIPPFSALAEEIQLWSDYGGELESVFTQLCVRDDILLVAECLQKTRDKMIILDILSNGLRAQLDLVHQYQTLLANVRGPFDELAAATDLDAVQACILRIFDVFQRSLRAYRYPFRGAVPLAEEICRVLVGCMSQILRSQRPLDVPLLTLEQIHARLDVLVEGLQSTTTEFRQLARELIRRRGERFMRIALIDEAKVLQARVLGVLQFRRQDDEVARDVLAGVDLLDVRSAREGGGREAWKNAVAAFHARVGKASVFEEV
ncbi:Dynein heavy chain protein 2 [Mycena chlorophos]|uniref:Dynein heavy chain protein 2 n=1 Tax=Mycena chlorophos TaxID=658473 RepID=A0A8H6SCT0_MYCCL|nr:Dynein heavy chain protein 2 [Mycena chlorophos]